MTNIKQRAQELLTCDELRGRVPEEVQKFMSDVVALEPVGVTEWCRTHISCASGGDANYHEYFLRSHREDVFHDGTILYTLGAGHDAA